MGSLYVPKGMLKMAALKFFGESSMSGMSLAKEISRVTGGRWTPGPGSIYLVLGDLLKSGMIAELPKREGNVRRYIITAKGKDALAQMKREAKEDVARQLALLGIYATLAGCDDIGEQVTNAAKAIEK